MITFCVSFELFPKKINLNEYEGSFLFKSPSSFSHSFIPNTAKLGMFNIFVIANIQSFTSQIIGVVGPIVTGPVDNNCKKSFNICIL